MQSRAAGSASCAHLYPLAVDGMPCRFNDPYANDQDWALVYWYTLGLDQDSD